MTTIRVSVRNLVEFVLQSGDLEMGLAGLARTQEAIRAHQYIQKKGGPKYLPEVSLSYIYQQNDVCQEIKGRADGIIELEAGFCIDEIKTTGLALELIEEMFNPLHWAQAEVYAFMYAVQKGFDRAGVQLTYYHLDSGQTKKFARQYSLAQLQASFLSLVERYLNWAIRLRDWSLERDESIRRLHFPFGSYRPGQRDLAVAVYKTIQQGQKLFAQAPTGTGKTIGTLFPAVKALAEGLTEQVFYLTAKTITRTVAEQALESLQTTGLAIKRLTLTAKDKICFLPESACRPEECCYAKGYYDRVRTAVEDVFAEESWTREIMESYARKHTICPFEFSLEMANWADLVICDYNYVFDPRVYLRRFFLDGGEYTFLVDEAHNLVDRAREMFSAELGKASWLKLKMDAKDFPGLAKSVAKVNSALVQEKKFCGETGKGERVEGDLPNQLLQALRKFVKEAENFLRRIGPDQPVIWREQLLDQYFEAMSFLRTADGYDERYVTYRRMDQEDFQIKLFCLDPSVRLKEAMERGKAAVLFSATLSPMDYFLSILGGDDTSLKICLDSPFPAENLCLLINNRISTKYNQRAATYEQVAEAIWAAVTGKEGNYLVFFPSYLYCQEVYARFNSLLKVQGTHLLNEKNYERFGGMSPLENSRIRVICQTPGMAEAERENFLAQFLPEPEQTLVGFALMGGIFGEGIDLIGNRLSGAVIVGVGLPQICLEREIIRSYFQTARQEGFEFAYQYPGFNKVLQAIGRVIRTEKDKGIVLLIDERFATSTYKRLFPKQWKNVHYVGDGEKIKRIIGNFWVER